MPEPRRREALHAAWETLVLLALAANLALLLFDSLYLLGGFREALASLSPDIERWYAHEVHARFLQIDLAFVALFVVDVLLGWGVALYERRYARWYYYPFAHWYDVLGCIPLAGLRWLRVLRIGVLLLRLQHLGVIDLRSWALYRFLDRYYQLLLEELSDRVMVKLFGRLQQEIGSTDDLSRRILDEVVRPRRGALAADIARRLQGMLDEGYRNNRGALEGYVGQVIHQALGESAQLRNLRQLPMGGRVADALEETLADIARRLLEASARGLREPQAAHLAERLAQSLLDAWLQEAPEHSYALEALLVDVLEVFKQQLLDRRWSRFVGPQPPL